MRLHGVKVKAFGRLNRPVELDNLDPRINVIHGLNEAGKTTLLQAIKAGLVTPFSSRSIPVPWGTEGLRPEVEVDFGHLGHKYNLSKGWIQRPYAELAASDGTAMAAGDAAEERVLGMLMGKRPTGPGRQTPDPGVLAPLLLEQGAPLPNAVTRDAAEQLAQAIQSVATPSSDRALRRNLDRAAERYLTPTGRTYTNSPVHQLGLELAGLRAERDDAADRLEDYEKALELLSSAEERQRTVTDELKKVEAELETKREAFDLARSRALAREQLRKAAQSAASHIAELQSRIGRMAELQGAVRSYAQELGLAIPESATIDELRALMVETCAALTAKVGQSEGILGLAGLLATERRLVGILGPFAEIDRPQWPLRSDLNGVRYLANQAAAARGRADAVGFSLSMRLSAAGEVAVEVDGECSRRHVGESEPTELAAVASARLQGPFGEVHVLSRAPDSLTLARRAAESEAQLFEALSKWNVRRLEDLEALCDMGEQVQREAPEGLPALRAAIAEGSAALAMAADDPRFANSEELAAELAAAKEEFAAASDASRDAAGCLREYLGLGNGRTLIDLRAELAAAQEAQARQEADLARSLETGGSDLAMTTAERRLIADRSSLIEERQRLEVDQALLRSKVAQVGHIGQRLNELVELIGLEERRLEAERLTEEAQRELRFLVQAAEREVLGAVSTAVSARASAILTNIVGRPMDVDVSSTLTASGYTVDGQPDVTSAELSHGTEEQAGLAVRLAIAEQVAEAFGESILLLDDPLTSSDQERRRRTLDELRYCDARVQVLIFTCRPEDFEVLDGARHAL